MQSVTTLNWLSPNYFQDKQSSSSTLDQLPGSLNLDTLLETKDVEGVLSNIQVILGLSVKPELLTQQGLLTLIKLYKLAQLAIGYLLHCKVQLQALLNESELKVAMLQEQLAQNKESTSKAKVKLQGKPVLLAFPKGLKPDFKCDQCHKVFIGERYLVNHRQRRHPTPSSPSPGPILSALASSTPKNSVPPEPSLELLLSQLRQVRQELPGPGGDRTQSPPWLTALTDPPDSTSTQVESPPASSSSSSSEQETDEEELYRMTRNGILEKLRRRLRELNVDPDWTGLLNADLHRCILKLRSKKEGPEQRQTRKEILEELESAVT